MRTRDAARLRLCLRAGEVVRGDASRGAVACRRGRVWITQTGLARDVILETGQTFQPRPTGMLIFEALEDTCLEGAPQPEGDAPAASRPPAAHPALPILEPQARPAED